MKRLLPLPLLFALGAPAYAQTGEEFFQRGQYAEAAAEFERRPLAGREALTLNKIGMSYHLMGRFKEAQSAYERALKLEDLAALRNNLGALFYSQRMFGDADREFRRAADRDADTRLLSNNLHWSRYARDNAREARERAAGVAGTKPYLLEPIEEFPAAFLAITPLLPDSSIQEAASRATRGDVFTARKMFEDAVIEYKRALLVDRYDSSVANRLGIAYHNLHKYRDAEQQYREALRLRPNHLDALNNLAVLDYLRHDYEVALSRYKSALKLKPDSVTVLRNMGACLFALERWDEGVAVYQQALALRPDLFDPQPSGAGTSIQMNQQQTAFMNFYLAKIFALRGDKESALSYLQKAVDYGFDNAKMMSSEDAFKALVADERFERMLKSIAERKSGNN
jgi:tetratricopeptide (TPR) repeat protein